MSTVLWGARKGDVQYASYDYWRRHIPIGASVVTVNSSVWFMPRATIKIGDSSGYHTISGIEPNRIGIGGLRAA